jgi:hypothetical protein
MGRASREHFFCTVTLHFDLGYLVRRFHININLLDSVSESKAT